ncbi:MAG TPA: PKD domain-containing protein [Solirubrobacteraceae bacterium]|nr:PKD domain-containing protein [Solirubrobacteraceae bacterium]
MSLRSRMAMFVSMLAVVCALPAGTAAAVELHPHVGRLPGFPAMRGAIPVLGSSSAVAQHEKLVEGAFAEAGARHASPTVHASPAPNEEFFSECEEEQVFFSVQDVCYRGGPVLRDPTIHLIFWQGPTTPLSSHTKLFPPHYMEIVERYFSDLAHDNNAAPNPVLGNTFAVEPQYYEESVEGSLIEGSSSLKFEAATDVEVDNSTFPSHTAEECKDVTSYSEGPCLLDSDIQAEAAKAAKTTSKGLGDLYLVLTPPGVGGCFEKSSGECAYKQYCAYHGDFGGDGVTPGQQTIYADLPYLGEVLGCDSGVHPNEAFSALEEEEAEKHGELLDEGADAAIDTANHEVNEAISDPIGSQCESGATKASECERNAWTDAIGQEIADKCLPPESTILGTYGEPLGEVLPGRPARAYNQLIDGQPYWAQRVWSNEAGLSEGACVQRRIEASFSISATRQATVPMVLNASSSGAPGDPADYWVWNFGGGEQVGTASPTVSHTFPQPGVYAVGVTVFDAFGNSQAGVGLFEVSAAPTPTPTPTPPAPPTPAAPKEPVAPAHLTAAQLAAKLGLPANGRKLIGLGPFTLGHAGCPPACGVSVQLFAKETRVVGKRRTTRLALIGSLHRVFAAKASGALALALNAKGKQLLHKQRTLACRLSVTVEGQEGGSWQIARSLTLKL